jgi:hypothetical protein
MSDSESRPDPPPALPDAAAVFTGGSAMIPGAAGTRRMPGAAGTMRRGIFVCEQCGELNSGRACERCHATIPRPKTAPGTAEWDMDEYQLGADHHGRAAKRTTLAVVLLTTATAAVGAFTAIMDEAILGVVTGLLGAAAAGLELWRGHNKSEARAAACRLGFVEIECELDLYYNQGAAYGEIEADQRQALLSERLAAINRGADERMR